jgi:voltage-gated potassium channel
MYKIDFMKLGWIDFISSIPMVGPLRYGRAIRVFRILRTLRGARSAKMILLSGIVPKVP